MKTGPAPKPTNLKTLEGNPGKRQISRKEPQPRPEMTTCPPFIKGAGRQEWKRITKYLYPLQLLTGLDRAALAGYCSSWGLWVEAEQELARLRREYAALAELQKKNPKMKITASNGMVVMTSNGNAIMEPMLSVRKQAMEQMHKFLVEFGMTPASRSRIEVQKPKKFKDPTEEFLDQANRKN